MEMIKETSNKRSQSLISDQTVAALRAKAAHNTVFRDMCKVFASRQRARQQVTVGALAASMRRAGYDYPNEEYKDILKFLAAQGIGHIDMSPRGKLRALKGIRVTLQSIGHAVVSNKEQLKTYHTRAKFVKVPNVPQTIVERRNQERRASTPATNAVCKVTFTIVIEGKPIVFEIPAGIKKEELGEFIASLTQKVSL